MTWWADHVQNYILNPKSGEVLFSGILRVGPSWTWCSCMFCTHVFSYMFFDCVLEYVIILFLSFLCGDLFYSLLRSAIICLWYLCFFARTCLYGCYTCMFNLVFCLVWKAYIFVFGMATSPAPPRKKLDPASDRLKIVHPFNVFFYFFNHEIRSCDDCF